MKFWVNIKIGKSALTKISMESMELGKMGLQNCMRARENECPVEAIHCLLCINPMCKLMHQCARCLRPEL